MNPELQALLDLKYAEITVFTVFLILLLFVFTDGFGYGLPLLKKLPSPSQTQPSKKEEFSPYESTLVHDMYRSDPSGDLPSANPVGRNNEELLFDQLQGWAKCL